MNPTRLSRELREETTPDLQRRRLIITLTLIGVTMGQLVSRYQTGIMKHLPDPPLDVFDSDKVDAADYAYSRFDTPDGLLMILTYAASAVLAGMGGKNRAQERPILPLLMGGKLFYDVFTAVELGREEWRDNKKLCAYCQVATLASIGAFILAIPEVVRAIRTLRSGDQTRIQEWAEDVRDRAEELIPA
jgi:uncharacterized membrane protein